MKFSVQDTISLQTRKMRQDLKVLTLAMLTILTYATITAATKELS